MTEGRPVPLSRGQGFSVGLTPLGSPVTHARNKQLPPLVLEREIGSVAAVRGSGGERERKRERGSIAAVKGSGGETERQREREEMWRL